MLFIMYWLIETVGNDKHGLSVTEHEVIIVVPVHMKYIQKASSVTMSVLFFFCLFFCIFAWLPRGLISLAVTLRSGP